MKKIVNRPGSLIDRPTGSRNINFVDDKIALIDQQLAGSYLDGDEESKKSDERPSYSGGGGDRNNKPSPAVLRRISKSLKERRKSNEHQETTPDPIHIACFKGNFLRVTDLVSKDPSLVNRVYNLNDGPLLSSGEADDPSYLPPPQVPKTIRAAVASAVNNIQVINRDQKWLIDNSFQQSSLLHFACVSDQREVVRYLLDQNIDVNLRNDAQKTAEFYTISDEIKELIISERKRRQRLSQMPAHQNAAITDYVNANNSDPAHNNLTKEHGNKILKTKRSSDFNFHSSAHPLPQPPLPQSPPPPPSPLHTNTNERKEKEEVEGDNIGRDSRYARFEKMRSLLPELAVRQKMSVEGFSQTEIEAFFNPSINTHKTNTNNTSINRPPPPPPSSSTRPRAPPPPPTNTTIPRERRESKASDADSHDESLSDNRSSKRLSARRLSRVLSSRRMSDNNPSTVVRDSDATVSDITSYDSVTGDARPKSIPSLILKPSSGSSSHKPSELPPRPRPAPPPPMKTPLKDTPSRQRSDTPPDSPPLSPPSDDDDDDNISPFRPANNAPPPAPPHPQDPQKRSLSAVLFNEDLLNQARSQPPPPPLTPASTHLTSTASNDIQPLALHRPPLAMRRLSVAPRSNELVTVLTESDITTGEVRVTEKKTEMITEFQDLTSVDKASLPVINKNLPVMKTFKRKSILDNLSDYLPSPTTLPMTNTASDLTTTNASINTNADTNINNNGERSRQPSVTSSTSHSATLTSAPSSSTAQKTTTSASVFNYNELSKEEKVVFHYLNLEKMLLKLVPLEDIANRVLIENAENDDVMMKKIIENPKHFLNKMSSTLAHIRLVTSDPASSSSPSSSSPKTTAAVTSRLLSSGTTTEAVSRLKNASPEKKLLVKHMIPTTVLATSAKSNTSSSQQQQQPQLTFREMLWKRAADYMNRGVFDSTGPEFHRLRQEAYELGVKLLQQEFKTLANKDHWESIDLVQKKTIHTILSLKQNLDQNTKSHRSGNRGSNVTSQLHRDRNISFDDIFENHQDATSLLRKVNRLSRQTSTGPTNTTAGQQKKSQRHVSVIAGLEDDMAEQFGADYYDYDIEEELEKLRLKFDQSDYDAFDVGRAPPPPPPPPRSFSSSIGEGGKGGGSGRIPSSLFPPPPPDEIEESSSRNPSLDNVEMSLSRGRAMNYPYDRSIVEEDEITRYFQAITDQ